MPRQRLETHEHEFFCAALVLQQINTPYFAISARTNRTHLSSSLSRDLVPILNAAIQLTPSHSKLDR